MTNIEVAEYGHYKKINDPEFLRIIRQRNEDPNFLTGKEASIAFFRMMGLDSNLDEIFDKFEN